MDTVRYSIALFLVLAMPGVYLFWFSIHPFVRFWRRVGPRRTLTLHLGLILLLAYGILQIREPLLSVEFGTNPLLIALAIPIFAVAVVLRVKLSKKLPIRVLIGVPELAPEIYPKKLITDGIYGTIRHPRYVELVLAMLAFAVFANYLAAYLIVLAGVAWIVLVARVEEKELRERFGKEYDAYCARVPRFLPRRSRVRSDIF